MDITPVSGTNIVRLSDSFSKHQNNKTSQNFSQSNFTETSIRPCHRASNSAIS